MSGLLGMTRLVFIAFSLLLIACDEPPASPNATSAFQLVFTAENDLGIEIPGVEFRIDGASVGTTGPLGQVRTTLEAQQGTTIQVAHVCPEGHTSEEDTQSLTLATFLRLGEETARNVLELSAKCDRLTRVAAFTLYSKYPNVPFTINGEVEGTTNENGFATYVTHGAPGARFEVAFVTNEIPNANPANPSNFFILDDRSRIFEFSEEIEEQRVRRPRRNRRRRGRSSIMRIQRINR